MPKPRRLKLAEEHGSLDAAPLPLVLIVEDEPQVMRFLRATLPGHGYRVLEAATGSDALTQAATRLPDLILLDLGLPDLDGVDVTRRIREWSGTPIIVISARESERQKVDALDSGADDYLTKPFGTGELLARMRVALRRRAGETGAASAVFSTGHLSVDLAARRVTVSGATVHLTRTEYNLLALLVKHAGKVVTHRQLLREVWGPSLVEHNHYVRVFMGQLRHKLEEDPARPRYILNETGVGYRLSCD
jgi:two-component system, OmpR family, KDP operon response regulator KdpE